MVRDLQVNIVASYISDDGAPRNATCSILLPFSLAAKAITPLKDNQYKFTLDTNRDPPKLTSVFDDMLAQPGVPENVIGKLHNSSTNVISFEVRLT